MNVSGRVIGSSIVASIAALLWLVGSAGPAEALTIAVPRDTSGSVTVTVTLDPAELSGAVTVFEDGFAVAYRDGVSSQTVVAGLPLDPGPHRFSATLRAPASALVLSASQPVYRWGTPGQPKWVDPVGGTAASPCNVRVRAGTSTASMTLEVNGVVIRTVTCRPGSAVTFGKAKLPSGSSTFIVIAESLYGERIVFSKSAKRVSYPYATCIIVDKSDFKLYWIRDDQLVKAYPIADGRGDCTPVGTWKILAKYKTDPHGVYGPRKMRLFRRVGRPGHYSYVYTAYGIHGTNQPWVIGTMASHGCIRMYNSDVLELWPQVPLGTMVITRA